jgi:hypothetical protein
MEKEAQMSPPEPANTLEEDVIDEKIKLINDKTIPKALISAVGIAFVSTICSSISKFFFVIIFFILIFIVSFAVMYKLLFYCFGKELVNEAKKRGKYWVKESDDKNNFVAKSYTPTTTPIASSSIVDYSTYDAINTANGNPPGLGYIGPIRNRD